MIYPDFKEFKKDCHVDTDDDYQKYDVISTLYRTILKEYVITQVEGGSGNGSSYELLSLIKMKKINKEKNTNAKNTNKFNFVKKSFMLLFYHKLRILLIKKLPHNAEVFIFTIWLLVRSIRL